MRKSKMTRTISDAVDGGVTGSITEVQALNQHRGFGVFAYYTNEKEYLGTTVSNDPTVALTGTKATDLTNSADQAAALAANFMWNQRVYDKTDNATPNWDYSPIKYWPNDNTTADDQDDDAGTDPAKGKTNKGKVSFFAYAPYTATVGTSGITAMTDNDDTGNPTITYKIATDGNVVDLLWGTAGTNGVKAQDGDVANPGNYIAVNPTTTPIWSDNPYKVNANLTKMKTPTATGVVNFNFKHALAKIGGSKIGSGVQNGLMIVADLDDAGAESGGSFETGTVGGVADTKLTKITVKSISITNDLDGDGDFDNDDKTAGAVTSKGTLDLATGQWTPSTNDADKTAISHIINQSGTGANATLAAAIAETTAPAKGDADNFFTCASTWSGQTGVPALNPINVYGSETNPFVFIPGTAPVLRFTINYFVRTYDAALDKGFSDVEQTITKKVSFPSLALNKQYNVLIHLGLTSVKFTATVSDWDVTTTDSDGDDAADADKNVYLPINVSD